MKRVALIFVLFILCKAAFALPTRLDTIDQRLYDHAKNAPAEVSQDIDKLVEYLKIPASNKRDIAKTFSYWIMQNISYDIEAFFNNSYNQDGITGTLRDKKGVCQDYSELFKAMCDRADIPCYFIAGYAKAFNYIPGTRFTKSNHAWNIILLDNNYFLMDLTWSSGYIANIGNIWRYFLKPDPTQFFADPAVFIEKHMPTDPKWQLLTHPVSMNTFLNADNRQQMLSEQSRYFNFRDSIKMFEQLSKEDQELKAADDAYHFYPVMSDYAIQYYNSAVNYSNSAIDFYNAAVSSYNKAIANKDVAKPVFDYTEDGISKAMNNYNTAIRLLAKIHHYSDNQIDADELLSRCNKGVEALKDLLLTLK